MATMSKKVILILLLISILFLVTIESKGGRGGGGSRGGGVHGSSGRSSSSSSGSSSGGYRGSSSGGRSSSSGGKSGSSSRANSGSLNRGKSSPSDVGKSSGGGGGIFGTRGNTGSSSGGEWFKSIPKVSNVGKSGGWIPTKSGGKFLNWPRGSSSVFHRGRSTRIIPIPIFRRGMGVGGWEYNDYGNFGHGYHGSRHYSRDWYKEEDGFYPCPPELVVAHQETLNKSVDEAIKSGQFDQLFLGTSELTDSSSDMVSSTLSRPVLIDQLRSAIANYTFMCYDESRDTIQNSNDRAPSSTLDSFSNSRPPLYPPDEFWDKPKGDNDDHEWSVTTIILFIFIIVFSVTVIIGLCYHALRDFGVSKDVISSVDSNQHVPPGAPLITPPESFAPQTAPTAPPLDPIDTMILTIPDPPPSDDETVKRQPNGHFRI